MNIIIDLFNPVPKLKARTTDYPDPLPTLKITDLFILTLI